MALAAPARLLARHCAGGISNYNPFQHKNSVCIFPGKPSLFIEQSPSNKQKFWLASLNQYLGVTTMDAAATALTILQNRDRQRARIKQIALKWARISRERGKEDLSPQNRTRDNVSAVSGP
jgi:hypothetical protein